MSGQVRDGNLPVLFIFAGLPGSGKTTLAQALARRFGAANVLRSPRATEMSVFVVRAFIKMREHLLSRAELETRLTQIENVLLSHDDSIRKLYHQIRPLLLPPPDPPAKRIGFHVRERRAAYRTQKVR